MIQGKGFYIYKVWNLADDVQTLISRAKQAGLEHVIIKISDKDIPFPMPSDDTTGSQEQFTHDAIAAFKSSGIAVAGWAFVYGAPAEPAAQARQFAARLNEFDLTFGVIDAEDITLRRTRYNWNAENAKIFIDTLLNELNRLGIADTTLALSSYRFMNVHGSFPFNEFMAGCKVAMPQVYWVQSDPVDDLKFSMRQYAERFPDKTFIPTGAAYAEGGWEATPQEVKDFLNQVSAAGIPTVNFWAWRNAWNIRPLWDAIAQYPFNPSTENVEPLFPVVPSDVNIEDDGEAVIRINAEGYAEGQYPNSADSLTQFSRKKILFKWATTRKTGSTVWAQWIADIPKSGRYQIEAFIPGKHGTTRHARYHVHGIVGADPVAVVEVNQLQVSDTYTPIGVFEVDADHPDCGKVSLNNFIRDSQEPEGKEIAFGPIRWTKLVDVPVGTDGGTVAARIRGVNINLDMDTTSPADLTPLAYCRFVYDLSQKSGNLDFNVVKGKYDAKLRGYIEQNVTPIAILNHEFYGEGQGFNWDTLREDNQNTRAEWARLSDKLAEFATVLARDYGDKIVYQIWNEADQASVAAVYVPPKSLAVMTDKCIDAILGVAPKARVITSGLVSGDTRYWQKTEASMKNASRLAGVALHAYGRGPTGRPARYQQFGKTKNLLNAYAKITSHKFWITEWGVTGDPSRSEPPKESPDNVAAYIKAFLQDVERDPRVEAAVYFAYADRMHNTYGLSLHTGEHKPKVWDAIAKT